MEGRKHLSCSQCLPVNAPVGAERGAKQAARNIKLLESGKEQLNRIHSSGWLGGRGWSRPRSRSLPLEKTGRMMMVKWLLHTRTPIFSRTLAFAFACSPAGK